MKSALFPRFGENLRPVWRFWQLWPSQMRFGQNVLLMTWKERFVQFSWKAHSFSSFARISGQCDYFENFDAQTCDLAKTCCAWPENSVLSNFHGERTVFPFWRDFGASFPILRTLTVKNAIWPKRAAHDLKKGFCTIFMKSALFSLFGENLRPVWRFWQLWRSQIWFGQNVLRMTWEERLVQFSWQAHCFPVLKRISGQCELWRSKMRFSQNVLRMTWRERCVQFSWKTRCFAVLKRIWDKSNDFEKFDPRKFDLAKTCRAWSEKSLLHNFYKKRTVFPFWGQFHASVTIFTPLTLKNAILQKRAPHDLKRAFCTIFMKSALFSRFGENLRPVWRLWQLWRSQMWFGLNVLRMTWKERFVQFSWKAHLFSLFGENLRPVWRLWQLWRSKMRFCQNVLRMTSKERFVQFSWKAHCFPVLKRIWDKCNDFEKFDPEKYDLGKTSCAWPETRVFYNFDEKRTFFPFWKAFQATHSFE